MAFRVFEGYDTDRAYTVAATGQQQGHPVPQVDLPAFFGDVEQPPFGNKAVEERELYPDTDRSEGASSG